MASLTNSSLYYTVVYDMNIYNIQELSNIIGTRQTWYSLLDKESKKDISEFQQVKKGNQNMILVPYDRAEIKAFYKKKTRDKGKKRAKKTQK